ncbi:MAG TPA: hypothetical protein VK474_07940, partial [Chthoniobacterales bacterium]|nr:hypothetical protein [Chthoniobacterales bacterium]
FGTHLWTETFDRDLQKADIFELQDEITDRVVATVADQYGVLARSMAMATAAKSPEMLTPYEAVLRFFLYAQRVTPEDHRLTRTALEHAVEIQPDYADAWACLATMILEEYRIAFNPQPNPLDRALHAAQRAVDADPASQMANYSLAVAHYFRGDLGAFRATAARALALNAQEGSITAYLGMLYCFSDDWERGIPLTARAMNLNPHHPGWYRFAPFFDQYRQRHYAEALAIAQQINLPEYFGTHYAAAIAQAQLGNRPAAKAAVERTLQLWPDFEQNFLAGHLEKWIFNQPELIAHIVEGLELAGLRLRRTNGPAGATSGTKAPLPSKSGAAAPAEEAFWVAVLPFKSSGGDEVESFADGLSDDITTGLSRFPYLSVVARAAAARLKGRAGDERTLGAEVGARYVVEGSIRKQASAIRVSARLIDTETGAQLWAESYDRDLEVSSIFAVQDDVAARIVATVADSYGVLVNSTTAQSNAKDDADLTPAEWQFQYFAYRQQGTPANHAALKLRLEAALERDKTRAEIWSCLAQMYVDAYAFGFQAEPDQLDRALVAARRGVEFDRTNQFGLVSLAQTYFFRQDLAAFRPAAERAMAINPLNTDALGILGLLIVHTGEFERGGAIVRHAMELNPDHAGWMHFGPIWEHFHKREYEHALDHANRVDMPGLFWPYLVVAAANGHLGRRSEAEAAVRDLLTIDPDFAAHARSNIASWHFASGLLEPLLDGLGKAGLPADHRFSDGL